MEPDRTFAALGNPWPEPSQESEIGINISVLSYAGSVDGALEAAGDPGGK
jgi:hypothetical protein